MDRDFHGGRIVADSYSVVIPTWNEAEWLPGLLANLRSFKEVGEIIVADNNSRDCTVDIAASSNARIISGGLPAVARNKGVAAAKNNLVLLIDADAAIPRRVIDLISQRFLENKRTALIHFRIAPISGGRLVRLCYRIMDEYFWLTGKIGKPQGVGTFMAVRKECFCAVGGFDERVRVGEDADLVRRIKRIGDVEYVRSVAVGTSIRRFRVENPTVFVLKTVAWGILRFAGLRFSVGSYRWKRYPEGSGKRDRRHYAEYLRRWDEM
ncbi:glycosyltransferase [Streptomyces europaeiscabiei]|uniref:glycosyltransferase n=1 Tax=Streptomyces europaeiscabiei TaxID=146819 RepID=UPI0029BA5B0E|nr:glycosyltransferase [Streptomyces europaeiscabiei]MDX3709062.1 glycosyltransferase [Streptomyces europaeiscabiei]